ncbi:MAG: carbohydrate binding domain-containing protein [Oscillospiraceae bacterium]|nr:carbohydrate binding domain-containing protein [Oscillospiraceae bacterium]
MRLKISSLLAKIVAVSMILASSPIQSDNNYIYADEKEPIFSADFEDGSISGWSPLGGTGTMTIDSANSYSGSSCLMMSERTQSWNGPALNATNILESGKKYTFEAYVYHEAPTMDSITWSIKFVGSDGIDVFNNVRTTDVPPGEWTPIIGSIEVPADNVSTTTYFESLNVDLNFCVDAVKIYEAGGSGSNSGNQNQSKNENAGQEQEPAGDDNSEQIIIDQNEYKYSFENDFERWIGRGEVRLMRNDQHFTEGQYSLYTTDRISNWNGPSVNADFIQRNLTYQYSADVMYNEEGAAESQDFQLNLQYDYDGNVVYQEIVRESVTKDEWKTLTGSFAVPAGAANVVLYLQTPEVNDNTTDNLIPFYIDNVIIADPTAISNNNKGGNIIFIIVGVAIVLIILTAIILRRKSSGKKTKLYSSTTSNNESLDAMTQALDKNTYEQKAIYLEDHPEECKNLHIALCDINFLGHINDNYGHEKGDEAIIRCAQVFLRAAGKKGTVYRTGGDEFMCMSYVSLEEDIIRELEDETQSYQGYPFFVAIGFAHADSELDSDPPDIKQIITRADQAMYENKLTLKAKHSPQNR